jgi:hypothetical protein
MVLACFVLGLGVAGFAGFVIGKKVPAKVSGDSDPAVAEVVPTTETEEKLDAAFSDLRAGNSRKALLGFQEIQSSLPGLYGVDFLVGYAGYFAGETSLARESFQTAVGKREMEEESLAMIALEDLSKDATASSGAFVADPVANAESSLKRYALRKPLDPRAYYLCSEMLRSKGSFRTAGALMAKSLSRTDPRFDPRLIEAKIVLTRLQNEPPKEVPPLANVTTLDGAAAIAAAYAALVNKRSEEGVLFLERASEFYPGRLFAELMKDQAFDEFRADPRFGAFLKTH